MDVELIKKEIEERALRLEKGIEEFRMDMLATIKAAQETQILTALKNLDIRLASIEARLPEPEND